MNQQTKPQTFAQKFPCFLTAESQSVCLKAARELGDKLAARRTAIANQRRVELALVEVSPTAQVIPFPAVKS